ncbi:prolactin receptor [Pelobates cultripes]|uniref:Prolactin receptor n=1 Tax=Pelobates cultripes TaxID=61616 RepID=A0AAD1WBP0_PELCU|nr:prolactin receptor [Pelobates cultripes]
MKKNLVIVALPLIFILLILVNAQASMDLRKPLQPDQIKCRSYEKETFSCWWTPWTDDVLPTNYSLFYRKETDENAYECPDYRTSGPNSCFFDKKYTSIWIYYFIYIKATNALGTNVSEDYPMDVQNIVQTHPPINITLTVDKDKPNLLINWLPPQTADVKSGWVTLQYELEIKSEKDHDWDSRGVHKQLFLKLVGLMPGDTYVVRVRCKPDNGPLWSEWSDEMYITMPGKKDFTLWISIGVLSFVICLTLIWTMALKDCSLMACIFPPVPGPKIMGFDTQLLKSGKSEDLLSALGCQGFPPTSDCEDLLVEFVEVDESKEHLITSQDRSPQGQHIKVCPVDTDNDSGRGSCDSPFAFSEACKELRGLPPDVDSDINDHSARKNPWPPQNAMMGRPCINFADSKSYVWPESSICGSLTPRSTYHNITDVCKLALGAMNANVSAFLMPNEDKIQPRYFKTIETVDESKQSELKDMYSKGSEPDQMHLLSNENPPFMSARTVDYVEVHKVNQNNALALIPKHKENSIRTDQFSASFPNREYTRVERVEGNSVFVLMQNLENQGNSMNIEPMKEYTQKSQQNPAEKITGFYPPAVNEGRIQTSGCMGYMDPSSFLS